MRHFFQLKHCSRPVCLGLAIKSHVPSMPKGENDIQALYKIVDAILKIQNEACISKEQVTKKGFNVLLQSDIAQK